jgi:hypothetical protein
MRIKSQHGVFVLAMVVAFLIGMDFRVEASQYLGEVTWTAQDSESQTWTMKAGISKMGGSYYQVQGQVPDAPFPFDGGTAIFSGGGALMGGNFVFNGTMTNTQNDGTPHITTFQITIDKSSFNGTFWSVTPRNYGTLNYHRFESEPLGSEYYHPNIIAVINVPNLAVNVENFIITGTLTLVGQPVSLTSFSPAVPLLLD